jgi:hypothetical protein
MGTNNVQTAFNTNPVVGKPGMLYDAGDDINDITSWIAAEDIPYGAYVVQTADGTCELPDSAGEVTGFAGGVALIDIVTEPTTVGYKTGDAVRVLRRGRVFVLNEVTFSVGDVMFVRQASGTGTQKGAFRNAADTATCTTPPRVSLFKAGAANLAVVDLVAPGN